jgi:hypothetical protein
MVVVAWLPVDAATVGQCLGKKDYFVLLDLDVDLKILGGRAFLSDLKADFLC